MFAFGVELDIFPSLAIAGHRSVRIIVDCIGVAESDAVFVNDGAHHMVWQPQMGEESAGCSGRENSRDHCNVVAARNIRGVRDGEIIGQRKIAACRESRS